MRLLLTTFLLLAGGAVPPTASAAELTLELDTDGVRFGSAHHARGKLTEAGAPLAGQAITVEARSHPYSGDFHAIGQVTTGADGSFAFRGRFERNAQLRAFATAQNVRSGVVTAYVFPRPRLTFRALEHGSVRLTQTYRVPRGSRFTAPTLFYVGPRSARSAPVVGRAKPRRIGPGRFRASIVYDLPRAWNGHFRYGTCFRYSPGSGLGDPKSTCPRRYRF